MAVSVVWWSAFTMVTGMMRSVPGLMTARLLLGAGEAGAYPACTKVVSLWFSRGERGIASGIFTSGVEVGSALSLPIVAWVIAVFGWKWSFLVTGTFGFVWVIAWIVLYRDPDQHLLELHQAGVISGTETMRLASNPEAVATGLRGLRQASTVPSPSSADLVAADPGLAP